MTDSRLQELERAWKASESLDDEAAYLHERVRTGGLSQERLELAAYCGHTGAEVATGVRADHAGPIRDWMLELDRLGARAVIGFCLCTVREVARFWDEAHAPRLRELLSATEAWLARPSLVEDPALQRLADQAHERVHFHSLVVGEEPRDVPLHAVRAADACVYTARSARPYFEQFLGDDYGYVITHRYGDTAWESFCAAAQGAQAVTEAADCWVDGDADLRVVALLRRIQRAAILDALDSSA